MSTEALLIAALRHALAHFTDVLNGAELDPRIGDEMRAAIAIAEGWYGEERPWQERYNEDAVRERIEELEQPK